MTGKKEKTISGAMLLFSTLNDTPFFTLNGGVLA